MNPSVLGVQLALFYKPVYLTGSTADVSQKLKENFGSDIKIMSYPIPEDAPAEIPRFEANLGNLALRFSNLRADLLTTEAEPTHEQVDKFIDTVLSFDTPVIRIGYVLRRVIKNVQEPSLRSNLHLNKINFPNLDEVAEATWRTNIIQTISGGDCNNISTVLMQPLEAQINLVLERDVNTVQSRQDIMLTEKESIQKLIQALKLEANSTFGIV